MQYNSTTMDFKFCSKCSASKPVEEYNWRYEEKGRRHSFCKECHSAYRRGHYIKNKSKYLAKAKVWNAKQTPCLRKFIVEYLNTHNCVDCGAEDIRVLDFDHEQNKYMGIANMIRNCHSLDSVRQEIKKCKVRCANCHRIKTFVRGNYWKNKMGL